MGLYLVVFALLSCGLIIYLWPAETPQQQEASLSPQGEPSQSQPAEPPSPFDLTTERRLILIALLAGAIGSCIHALQSLAAFIGNEQLYRSWKTWYLVRPVIGMSLALIVYFAARGTQMLGAEAGAEPFGTAALAGLSGMFSKQATEKLEEVFSTLLQRKKSVEYKNGLSEDANRHPPQSGTAASGKDA